MVHEFAALLHWALQKERISDIQSSYPWSLAAPLAASPLRYEMMLIVSVIWFKALNGVLGIAQDMILRGNACTRSIFLTLCLVCVALIYILAQYLSIGSLPGSRDFIIS